jgi:NADH-quinone oxidoreductase subunit J
MTPTVISTSGQVLFLICAFFALLSAVGTVTMHSPIRAAMSLLAHIVSLTGLFLVLHAHLVAALQVLVYAGAVVVLFVFVIMLIGPASVEPAEERGMVVKAGSVALMGIVTAILAFSLVPTEILDVAPIFGCTPAQGAECSQFGGVGAFAQSLFMDALVPFELISVLLTVAIVGAIAVARGRSTEETDAVRKKRELSAPTSDSEQAAPAVALATEAPAHGGRS